MKKDDKDINILMKQALKESNEYLEMYELKLTYYKNNLEQLEKKYSNSLFNNKKYEEEKNDILNNLSRYEEKIKEEKKLIEIIKKNIKQIK